MRIASKLHICTSTFVKIGGAKGYANLLPSVPPSDASSATPAFPLNGASRVEFVIEVDATSPVNIPTLKVYFYPITGLNWTDGVNYGPVGIGNRQRVILPSVGADYIQIVAEDLVGNPILTMDLVGANT